MKQIDSLVSGLMHLREETIYIIAHSELNTCDGHSNDIWCKNMRVFIASICKKGVLNIMVDEFDFMGQQEVNLVVCGLLQYRDQKIDERVLYKYICYAHIF